MSPPTIVIVENRSQDNVPLFDFLLMPSGENKKIGRTLSTTITEITDIEDAADACREESTIPPGCLPEGHERSIDLSQRRLENFPVKVFVICKQLTYLYLQDNLLESLPEELFTTFLVLRRLDVRRNNLTSIPASIAGHPALEVFLLQNNKISKLPPHLGRCRTLRNLQLQGNPLEWPDENTLGQGTQNLLAFLRENDRSDDVLKENRRVNHVEKKRLEEFRKPGSGDSRNQSENVILSRKSSTRTNYSGIALGGGGEYKSCTKGPRNTPTAKTNSKKSLRRKSAASFDDEDQATVICRRGQFPLGYQKRMSYVSPNQVYETLRKELWKDILRRELLLQDYLLQRKRDSETLRKWRQKTRIMQLLPKGEREPATVPFDQDENLQMMTWVQLLQARNHSLEKKGHSKPGPLTRRAPDRTEGIIKLLREIDKLKEESNQIAMQPDDISQYRYRMLLSTQINKVRKSVK